MSKLVSVKNGGTGDPALDLAAGAVDGFFVRNIFARIESAQLTTDETLWGAGNLWVGPTVAQVHTLVSDDAADDAATGQGAHEVRVRGLLTWRDQDETEEIVIMDGIVPVDTVNSYVVVNDLEITAHGTSATNVGNITLTAKVDATVQRIMHINEGKSLDSMIGFPESFTAFITGFTVSVLSKTAGNVTATLQSDRGEHLDLGPNSGTAIHIVGAASAGSSFVSHEFNPYIVIPGPALISMKVNCSSNNMDVAGGYDIIFARSRSLAALRNANATK